MKILKKYLIFWIFLFLPNIVLASLEITEIMYAPISGADYEWVEVYNNSLESIDLDKYRFFHGQTNSGPITLKNGPTKIIQPKEYIVITKSMADYSWLNFKGPIFSASVLSLPDKIGNTYIAISDKDKNIIDSLIYDPSLGGSKASKSSLSKINGLWQNGIPTPGTANKEMKIIKKETIKVPSNLEGDEKVNNNSQINNEPSNNLEKEIINLNNLGSNKINRQINIFKYFSPTELLIAVIGLGIIIFLVIRKKYDNKDFLEKEIKSSDIKIIE